MDRIRWIERAELRHPAAVVAFEGWGDAGEASSAAIDHLLRSLDGEPVAIIDADEYFDFQVRRPHVRLVEGGTRSISWPDTRVYAARVPHGSRDLVIVRGEEPHARWKAFSRDMAEVFAVLGVETMVALGAFVGQVPHTLPVPLVGTSTDPDRLHQHHVFASGYEGPTGIVGVLGQTLASVGIEAMSVWAAVPHYLSNQTYPPGTLALLDTVVDMLELPFDTSPLAAEAADYRRSVDAAIEDSEELSGYVDELESSGDGVALPDSGDAASRLVEEIERYLRDG